MTSIPPLGLYHGWQPTIRVQVKYFNDQHKTLFLAYPNAEDVEKLVSKPVEIATPDFLTYYLFQRQDPGRPNFETYRSCGQRHHITWADMEDMIQHNGTSIQLPVSGTVPLGHVTEYVGDSIGLNVLNSLYNLHEADWRRIPIVNTNKTLDFNYKSSDGNVFIELETKGISSPNNALRSGLSEPSGSINDKKVAQRGLPSGAGKMFYGTITVLDALENSIAKCWLLDPPPDGERADPRTYRLLARLDFLSEWITFIAPTTHLAATLATRLQDLAHLPNSFDLDGSPLRDGLGEPIRYVPFGNTTHSTFFANRSRVVGSDAGGVIVPWSENEVAFFGVRQQIIDMSAEQVFDTILSYKFSPEQREAEVDCVIGEGRFNSMKLGDGVKSRKQNGYRLFTLKGLIQFSSGGLAFGVLPLKE